jgi:hypothetical protein
MYKKELNKSDDFNVSFYDISKEICNNNNNEHQCFLYNDKLRIFCLIIDEEEKYENISKKSMINNFTLCKNLKIKSIFLLINEKNKDILKITQIINLIGFKKENILKSTLLNDGNIYLIFKMNVEKEIENNDEIEDIDF